jgi:hypothetical protein
VWVAFPPRHQLSVTEARDAVMGQGLDQELDDLEQELAP